MFSVVHKEKMEQKMCETAFRHLNIVKFGGNVLQEDQDQPVLLIIKQVKALFLSYQQNKHCAT